MSLPMRAPFHIELLNRKAYGSTRSEDLLGFARIACSDGQALMP